MTSEREFEEWWNAIGSKYAPQPNYDMEEHAKAVSELAWQAARQDWPSEDEAVEIMCRAVTDNCLVGSDAMVFLSMEDAGNDIRSPNWQRHQHEMRLAYRALRNAPQDRG